MYRSILKKDLSRKKATNIILLIFIILATMFVFSGVSNIAKVTTTLDRYFEMAQVPDYFVVTMNKATGDVDQILDDAESVDQYQYEEVLYLTPEHLQSEREIKLHSGSTMVLQSDKDISMQYILSDGSMLETIQPGELYMTEGKAKLMGFETGDKIQLNFCGISHTYTLVGTIKDALMGSNQVSVTRFFIGKKDYLEFQNAENAKDFYGGKLIYIQTSDQDALTEEIRPVLRGSVLTFEREEAKQIYIFDMVISGVFCVISVILIVIAFFVLRFTIYFTLTKEFREIGIMKAIGIKNSKIRGLYLVKYGALSFLGAGIGFVCSFPFERMLSQVSATTIWIGTENTIFLPILCAVFVMILMLTFCWLCTGRVKRMTPIDAVRNGQSGERFRKKSLLSLGKSKFPCSAFLALNDIFSSPKQFGIITGTFFSCLSLLLMLSSTASTLSAKEIVRQFSMPEFDLMLDISSIEFMTETGREKTEAHLAEMESRLEQNDIPAKSMREISFKVYASKGEKEAQIFATQGVGTTMDQYEYLEGLPPCRKGEIAITKKSAENLDAHIGDTICLQIGDTEQTFLITAFMESMTNMGDGIRFYTDESLNYNFSSGSFGTLIKFTDNPDDEKIENRIETIKGLYPEAAKVQTASAFISEMVGMVDTIQAIKHMIAGLTVLLCALVTVLMERSFLVKERGEIALMKAMGIRSSMISAYHTMRFVFVGIMAVIVGEIFAMPLTHLCIDPIFGIMGAESSVSYVVNGVEMYFAFPALILAATWCSAFFTSLYIRKIQSSDIANLE